MSTTEPAYYQDLVAGIIHKGETEPRTVNILALLLDVKIYGDAFYTKGDYAHAVMVYQIVLLSIIESAPKFTWHYDDFFSALRTCVDAFSACLQDVSPASDMRFLILKHLFALCRYEMDLGGLGLNEYVADVFIDYTTPQERQLLAQWVEPQLTGEKSDAQRLREYWWGGLLLRLQADTLSEEAFVALCWRTERYEDLLLTLLKQQKIQDALHVIEHLSSYDLYFMGDMLLKYGYDEAFEQSLYERALQTRNILIIQRLSDYYQTQREYDKALKFAKVVFYRRPSLEVYRRMRQMALHHGSWHELRAEMLAYVQKIQFLSLLIYIALDEGEFERALSLLNSQPAFGEYEFLYSRGPAILAVAKAVEKAQPQTAIELYQYHVDFLIARRTRDQYRVACKYLVMIKILYEHMQQSESWEQYFAGMQQCYKTLRALKDEMSKAQLLKPTQTNVEH